MPRIATLTARSGISFSYVGNCRLASGWALLAVGVKVVVDDPSETAFKAAQRFGGRLAGGQSLAVVGLAETVEADLSQL
jgi:hypothetical protein